MLQVYITFERPDVFMRSHYVERMIVDADVLIKLEHFVTEYNKFWRSLMGERDVSLLKIYHTDNIESIYDEFRNLMESNQKQPVSLKQTVYVGKTLSHWRRALMEAQNRNSNVFHYREFNTFSLISNNAPYQTRLIDALNALGDCVSHDCDNAYTSPSIFEVLEMLKTRTYEIAITQFHEDDDDRPLTAFACFMHVNPTL